MGVTKRCRLSWLVNSALVYEPKCGGGGASGVRGVSHEYSCAHGSQINFGDLTPYLTYDGWDVERELAGGLKEEERQIFLE